MGGHGGSRVPPADGGGVVGVVDLDPAAVARAGAEVLPVVRASEEDSGGVPQDVQYGSGPPVAAKPKIAGR